MPVAYLIEEHRWKRVWATIVSALIIGIIGITATLSTSVLANFKPLLGKTIFDLCDFASSNILLPVGGIFICLFVGWHLGRRVIFEEALQRWPDPQPAPAQVVHCHRTVHSPHRHYHRSAERSGIDQAR